MRCIDPPLHARDARCGERDAELEISGSPEGISPAKFSTRLLAPRRGVRCGTGPAVRRAMPSRVVTTHGTGASPVVTTSGIRGSVVHDEKLAGPHETIAVRALGS